MSGERVRYRAYGWGTVAREVGKDEWVVAFDSGVRRQLLKSGVVERA